MYSLAKYAGNTMKSDDEKIRYFVDKWHLGRLSLLAGAIRHRLIQRSFAACFCDARRGIAGEIRPAKISMAVACLLISHSKSGSTTLPFRLSCRSNFFSSLSDLRWMLQTNLLFRKTGSIKLHQGQQRYDKSNGDKKTFGLLPSKWIKGPEGDTPRKDCQTVACSRAQKVIDSFNMNQVPSNMHLTVTP